LPLETAQDRLIRVSTGAQLARTLTSAFADRISRVTTIHLNCDECGTTFFTLGVGDLKGRNIEQESTALARAVAEAAVELGEVHCPGCGALKMHVKDG
jgi:phenylpyruvate tautomerase PptA (4-oxalocrotonate tautomerase family)